MNGRNDTQEVEDDGFYTVEFNEPSVDDCPNCEGTGTVTGAWASGAMASDIDECPVCRGTGVAPFTDPTPWCHGCGAMRKETCHCGPLADND